MPSASPSSCTRTYEKRCSQRVNGEWLDKKAHGRRTEGHRTFCVEMSLACNMKRGRGEMRIATVMRDWSRVGREWPAGMRSLVLYGDDIP